MRIYTMQAPAYNQRQALISGCLCQKGPYYACFKARGHKKNKFLFSTPTTRDRTYTSVVRLKPLKRTDRNKINRTMRIIIVERLMYRNQWSFQRCSWNHLLAMISSLRENP